MTRAIRFHTTGGPEVLQWEEAPTPSPKTGEVLIRHLAVGVNFIDVYHRTGLYPVANLPAIPGMEGCGIIEKLGEGVTDFRVGDRVVYGMGPMGAYTEQRVIPVRFLVKVPEAIGSETAAASMLKGLTAHYLLRQTFRVEKGITILIHAAAGGVGLILCQWAKYLGAQVIGTVSNVAKAAIAADNGCDYPLILGQDDVVQSVKDITGGKGVNVVYDGVGKDTFEMSLDCLTRWGLMVSFGQSSGKIPPFDVSLLAQKGSLFFTRPTLMHYKDDQAEYIASAVELYDLMIKGVIKIRVGQTYHLHDAAEAHRALEARKTNGATVLVVGGA